MKPGAERGRGERLPEDHREEQTSHADRRGFGHPALPEPVHVKAHEQRERNRDADRERAPGALLQGIDDSEAEPGQRDHDHEQDRDARGDAGDGPDLGTCDLCQRSAAPPCGGPEDDEVLDRPCQADTRDEPDQPGRVAELSGEHGTDERARASDRGEMMTEQDEAMRRMVVVAVVAYVRRRRPRVVERHDACRDERAVVAIGDRQDTKDRQDDVEGAHHSRRSAVGQSSRQSRSTVTVDSRRPSRQSSVGQSISKAAELESGCRPR